MLQLVTIVHLIEIKLGKMSLELDIKSILMTNFRKQLNGQTDSDHIAII